MIKERWGSLQRQWLAFSKDNILALLQPCPSLQDEGHRDLPVLKPNPLGHVLSTPEFSLQMVLSLLSEFTQTSSLGPLPWRTNLYAPKVAMGWLFAAGGRGKTELELVGCSDYTQGYRANINVKSRKDKDVGQSWVERRTRMVHSMPSC